MNNFCAKKQPTRGQQQERKNTVDSRRRVLPAPLIFVQFVTNINVPGEQYKQKNLKSQETLAKQKKNYEQR